VFIHIPKCAGSSLSHALVSHFGREKSYLIGRDSSHNLIFFPAKAVAGKSIISGHRAVNFYPHQQHFVFISIIRDPVSRALSLYNYVSQPQNAINDEAINIRYALLQKWRKKGIDPDSLIRSIENSPQLRYAISNAQCRFLSDNKKNWLSATFSHYVTKKNKANFKTVLSTLNNRKFIIGTQNNIQALADRLSDALGFPLLEIGYQNTSKEFYLHKFQQDHESIELIKSLNIEDQKLHHYITNLPGGIFENFDVCNRS